MTPVLQAALPHAPWMDPVTWKMPGVQPLDPTTWLQVDDAFGGQMAVRDGMIGALQEDIYAQLPEAEEAAQECLDHVLEACAANPGYEVGPRRVRRPDGVKVIVHRTRPLLTIGRLIQEDICLMQPGPDGHVLTGAILCFPSSWTLSEKIGRPLVRIHKPVAEYDETTARRVQRLFDGIKVGRPMWRANAHLYETPDLFTPRREDEPHRKIGPNPYYLRSERQTLKRLPKSGAVVFAIHTYVVHIDNLSPDQRTDLESVRRKTVG